MLTIQRQKIDLVNGIGSYGLPLNKNPNTKKVARKEQEEKAGQPYF